MGTPRIIYQNWIVENGADPNKVRRAAPQDDPVIPNAEIVKAVRLALKKLPPLQKELVERFYFVGLTIEEISGSLDLSVRDVQAFLRDAVRSLKRSLTSFVEKKFGVAAAKVAGCPLCASSFRDEIDRLISAHKPRQTWSRIIKTLRIEYGIHIIAPQILISHKKYHIRKEI